MAPHPAGKEILIRTLRAQTVRRTPLEVILAGAVIALALICTVYAIYWAIRITLTPPTDVVTAVILLLLVAVAWLITGLLALREV